MVMAAVVMGVSTVAAAAMAPGAPDIPPPDPSVGRAQESMAALAERQQDYYENTISPLLMEQLKQQTATAKATSDASIAQMNTQTDLAKKYDDRYWNTQVPLEDQLIAKAKGYNEKSEQERMAGEAGADVMQATNIGQQSVMQSLRARGVDLGSGAAVSAMTEMNTQAMLAKAGAMNKTRETARQMGWQKLGEATALGKGLPSFGAGSTQLALGAAGAANQSAASGTNGVATAAGVGTSNTSALGGLYGNIGSLGMQQSQLRQQGAQFNANFAAANDPTSQLAGAAAGYGMSYLGKKYGG